MKHFVISDGVIKGVYDTQEDAKAAAKGFSDYELLGGKSKEKLMKVYPEKVLKQKIIDNCEEVVSLMYPHNPEVVSTWIYVKRDCWGGESFMDLVNNRPDQALEALRDVADLASGRLSELV